MHLCRATIVLLAAACLAGCASGFTRLGPKHPPRPDDAWVDLYISAGAPYSVRDLTQNVGHPPGEPIARADVSGPLGTTPSMLISKAKSVAREAGGDAIVITGGDDVYPSLSFTVYLR